MTHTDRTRAADVPPTPNSVTTALHRQLRLPLIAAPLFIASGPELVIAQCKAGIVGSFPALNARPQSLLDEWLSRIEEELAAYDRTHPETPSAPYAVNQIVHKSNDRLDADMATVSRHEVPIVITSLGARPEINDAVHRWGGITFHDITNRRFAEKAVAKGADGLVAVAAGAGGHAGAQSPFAMIQEIREFFDGPLALSGAIATGRALLAARVAGADFGYIGSAFIATDEANAVAEYKRAIVDYGADDIIRTNLFTGVHGNYLKPSIRAAGLDPEQLPESSPSVMNFASQGEGPKKKAWKDIWGCGQGIGAIKSVSSAAAYIAGLETDYRAALAEICRNQCNQYLKERQ
jgi:nitronate monooxygenase